MVHFLKLILTIFILGFPSVLFAQSPGVIKGKIEDSVSGKPLSFATITAFRARDTSLVAYILSDPEGNFELKNIASDLKINLLITYSGYSVGRTTILLSKQKNFVNLGVIHLSRDSRELEEILITAESPPVIVRNDTIEFNASSFKTLPNALVEDLLKKLPGVKVNRTGEILVNGKNVNKIIVDGKEFFGGDVKIASRNLPANIIDKIEVTDDQEQLEDNFSLTKANVGKVINLKLKKGVKKGFFGKVYGGKGDQDRYETGGIGNIFRDTLQLSVLAYTNNINKPGFGLSDVKDIGGFDRSGYSSTMTTHSGAFTLDNISFGATSEGIQKSSGAGFNFNTLFGEKVTVNLTYFYGRIKSDFEKMTNTLQFFGDSVLTSEISTTNFSTITTNRISSDLKWKLSPTSTITVKPSISFFDNKAISQVSTIENSNYKGLLLESINNQIPQNSSTNFSNELSWRKSFSKKGRSLLLKNNIS